MKFLEKDLEKIIVESNKKLIRDRGLYMSGTVYNQVRIGEYGIADVITIERPIIINGDVVQNGCITVFELKQDKIGISAFLQALGYLKGIVRYAECVKGNDLNNFDFKITLIGKEVDKNSTFIYLPDFMAEVDYDHRYCDHMLTLDCYEYLYELEGIRFNKIEGFRKINEGF